MSSSKAEKSAEAARVATAMEAVKSLKKVTEMYTDAVRVLTATLLSATIDHDPADLMAGVRQVLKERGLSDGQTHEDKKPQNEIKDEPQDGSPVELKGVPIQMLFDFMKSTGTKELHIIDNMSR